MNEVLHLGRDGQAARASCCSGRGARLCPGPGSVRTLGWPSRGPGVGSGTGDPGWCSRAGPGNPVSPPGGVLRHPEIFPPDGGSRSPRSVGRWGVGSPGAVPVRPREAGAQGRKFAEGLGPRERQGYGRRSPRDPGPWLNCPRVRPLRGGPRVPWQEGPRQDDEQRARGPAGGAPIRRVQREVRSFLGPVCWEPGDREAAGAPGVSGPGPAEFPGPANAHSAPTSGSPCTGVLGAGRRAVRPGLGWGAGERAQWRPPPGLNPGRRTRENAGSGGDSPPVAQAQGPRGSRCANFQTACTCVLGQASVWGVKVEQRRHRGWGRRPRPGVSGKSCCGMCAQARCPPNHSRFVPAYCQPGLCSCH